MTDKSTFLSFMIIYIFCLFLLFMIIGIICYCRKNNNSETSKTMVELNYESLPYNTVNIKNKPPAQKYYQNVYISRDLV